MEIYSVHENEQIKLPKGFGYKMYVYTPKSYGENIFSVYSDSEENAIKVIKKYIKDNNINEDKGREFTSDYYTLKVFNIDEVYSCETC